MTLEADLEVAALPEASSGGYAVQDISGFDAPVADSLLLSGGDGSVISNAHEISQELLLSEEEYAGQQPERCCKTITEPLAAACLEHAEERYDTSVASTGNVSPALNSTPPSQRIDNGIETSMLSPQLMDLSRPDSKSAGSNQRTHSLFSPTPHRHNIEINSDMNLSASSLESIGKISDRDLLSPILQSGNGDSMRFSIGTISRTGGDEAAAESSTPILRPKIHTESGDTSVNGSLKNNSASSNLSGSAKRVILRFEDLSDSAGDEDEEEAPPEPVSTPKRQEAESFLDIHESLRSPCPTIIEEDGEEETTESEPSIDHGAENPPNEQPFSTSALATFEDAAELFVESPHPERAQNLIECFANSEPVCHSDTSLSPLKSVHSAERRRSLNLIDRLHRTSFSRRIQVSGPEGASLRRNEDDDNGDKFSAVQNDDIPLVTSHSQTDCFMDTDADMVLKNAWSALESQNTPDEKENLFLPSSFQEDDAFVKNAEVATDSLLIAVDRSVFNVNDVVAAGKEQAQANPHLKGDSVQLIHEESSSTLGASSISFIEQLRGAALRRKMNLSRSRDSLAAKEQKQRSDIAASEAAQLRKEEQERQASAVLELKNRRKAVAVMPSTHTFKARALPQTSGHLGSGGLAGVPKVAKKPTTAPLSPFLGARRQLRKYAEISTTDQIPDQSKEAEHLLTADQNQFKARPLPKTTRAHGGSGHSGVPKVPKRHATVPFSPLLGPRRKPQTEKAVYILNHPKLDDIGVGPCRRLSTASQASASSGHSLVGLEICNQKENNFGRVASDPLREHVVISAFVPRSTARAEQRALFEAERKVKAQQRKEQQERERNVKLKALRKELLELRMSL